MRDDFAVFILTHGRPDRVSLTISSLKRSGYTGAWYLVLDDEDDTRDLYAARWGADRILTFNKDAVAKTFDLADNGGSRGVIVYARNAVDSLAAALGLTYYQQLDDDYTYFSHRYTTRGHLTYAETRHLDDVAEAFIDWLEATGALTVAYAQGGDLIGGARSVRWRNVVLRKAMNTFICKVGRPVGFVGRINEDVNTYVWRGSTGSLFLTAIDFSIGQKGTQSQAGGMTGAYLDHGTYVKSFYSILFAPSCVRIGVVAGGKDMRMHHHISWNHAVPKIVSSRYRKATA